MKNILIFCLCFSSIILARNVEVSNSPLKPSNFNLPEDKQIRGRSNEKIDDLNINKFYLNIDSQKVKEVQTKDKSNKHLLDKFDNITINQKPVVKSITSQDAISIHPYFTTTILLPKGSIISFARGKRFEKILFDQNMLTVDVDNSFDRGNLVIVYSEKNQNKILNLMVKRFDKSEIKKEVLNTVYSYKNYKPLTDVEVIQAYIKEYNSFPMKKFNYLYVADVVYRIVLDNEYGNVFVNGNKYRVDNGLVHK